MRRHPRREIAAIVADSCQSGSPHEPAQGHNVCLLQTLLSLLSLLFVLVMLASPAAVPATSANRWLVPLLIGLIIGNPHDPLAVRIEWQGAKLGYVHRPQNADIAARLIMGEPLVARIDAIDPEAEPRRQVGFVVEMVEENLPVPSSIPTGDAEPCKAGAPQGILPRPVRQFPSHGT
ncbi:MAG: hypothetical protein Fur0019_15920 [Tibeticola sp.]